MKSRMTDGLPVALHLTLPDHRLKRAHSAPRMDRSLVLLTARVTTRYS
jgi:hypothetical protein